MPEHTAEKDAPALSAEEHASLVTKIRENGAGLLDLLEDAEAAMLEATPGGTFINPRPLQEAVLAAWLEANGYSVTPPGEGKPLP